MKKKAYQHPCLEVTVIEPQQLLTEFSGGGSQEGDPKVDPNADNSDDDNRSRRGYSVWDDEDVD